MGLPSAMSPTTRTLLAGPMAQWLAVLEPGDDPASARSAISRVEFPSSDWV